MTTLLRKAAMLCSLLLCVFSSLVSAPITRDQLLKRQHESLESMLQAASPVYRNRVLARFEAESHSYSNQELQDERLMTSVKCAIVSDIACTIAREEAKRFSQHTNEIDSFVDSYRSLLLNKLSNKEPLNDPFGKDLQAAVQSHFGKQSHSASSCVVMPTQPKPSAPAMPVTYQPTNQQLALYYAHKEIERQRLTSFLLNIDGFLATSPLGLRNGTRFKAFFLQSVQHNSSEYKTTPHLQNAYLALFNYELNHVQNKLSAEIKPHLLQQAVKTTRDELSCKIKAFTDKDAKNFRNILNYLEETVIDNAGIACAVCTTTYKQDDMFGTAEKINLQSNGKECHSLCKTCAKQGFTQCPQCNRRIDQQDLKRKVAQPDSPANWHP